MGYINLFIENGANINVKQNQVIINNTNKVLSFPLEDINSILIENLSTNISAYTLSKLASEKAIIYFCDEKHLPNAYLLPYNGYFKQLEIYEVQTQCPKPLQKRLWQKIVQNKIKNQAECLKVLGNKNHEEISRFIKSVISGDVGNIEAVSAKNYFKKLCGDKFNRSQENYINAALNYGYAIIRGAVARNICSNGLLMFLGINHCNKLNAFNLADDLIEVFRPVVDLFVMQNLDLNQNNISPSDKKLLYNLLNSEVLINNNKVALSYGIEVYVNSFIKSMKENDILLKEIEIMTFKMHEYE